MLRAISAIVVFVLFAACSDQDETYRYEGAGLSLYSETKTSKSTRNLLNYFDQLCGQAAIGVVRVASDGRQSYACPTHITPPQYTKLMQAGFNDIDLRCDQYLGWIDRKRIEALTYRRGAGALEALLGAGFRIGDAGPDAYASLLAVFSFARDVYDASNTSLLAALESSTIKTLVYKRQKAFRAAAGRHARGGASRESVVYALRNYLLICTPQTIVLDANTFSRDPEQGSIEQLESDFTERFDTLSPTVVAPAAPAPRNVQAVPSVPSVASFRPFSASDVRRIQSAACIPVDGRSGPQTERAVLMLHQFRSAFDEDPKLSRSEWESVSEQLRPCDRTRFKNIYENVAQSPDAGAPVVNQLIVAGALDLTLRDRPLNDPAVRAALSAKRQELNLREPELGIDISSDQLTPNLMRALSPSSF